MEVSDDPQVIAVAAHDVGEYVRHYPRGKRYGILTPFASKLKAALHNLRLLQCCDEREVHVVSTNCRAVTVL